MYFLKASRGRSALTAIWSLFLIVLLFTVFLATQVRGQQLAYDRTTSTDGTEFSEVEKVNDSGGRDVLTAPQQRNRGLEFAEKAGQTEQVLAFASTRDGNKEIYRMDGNGSNQVRLTNNSAEDEKPVISPDGQSIVFASNRTGQWELFEIPTTGGSATQLTDGIPANDEGVVRGIDWHPDGSKLIFSVKETDGGTFEIYQSDADGSNIELLIDGTVDGQELDAAHPEYTPDGSKIVMDRNVPFQGGTSEIWIADADGTNLTELTDALDPARATFAGESGDLKIVHSRETGSSGSRQIWKMNTDGSGAVNLSVSGAQENQARGPDGPNRSAVGNQFLFRSDRGGEPGLWKMNLDGSNAMEITTADVSGRVDWWVGNTPIPVELARFNARTAGDDTAVLTWQTATETNNAGFDVQHQPPENKTWAKIGFVESKAQGGTTSETRIYRFTTEDLKVGVHQFRLKQVDLDGSSTLSDPVTVDLQMDGALRLSRPSPNPVSETATFSFAVRKKKKARITLYNVLGQKVRALYRDTPTAGESQTVRLSTSDLPSGTYFLRLSVNGKVKTRQLTVVR